MLGGRAAYVGGLPLAVAIVTTTTRWGNAREVPLAVVIGIEHDSLGMRARRTRPGFGCAAATVGLCPGHAARRRHLAAARCGGWLAV
jgi:hypothetical protein